MLIFYIMNLEIQKCNKHKSNKEFVCMDQKCNVFDKICLYCIKDLHPNCNDEMIIEFKNIRKRLVRKIEKEDEQL